jgi:hypothetical protein
MYAGFLISSERSIRSRRPSRCRGLGYVVWNDSVRIGDDAIGATDIFCIRVSSSPQGAAALRA